MNGSALHNRALPLMYMPHVCGPNRRAIGVSVMGGRPMAGETVFVSGGYDVIHGGHIEFFERAKALGDRLVVCIPSDRVMRAYKGRVTLPASHKARVIGGLRCVAEVVVGNDEPAELNFASHFRRLRPQKLVATVDDGWPDAKRSLCSEVGAEYVQLARSPSWPDFSTTEMLRRARNPVVPARVDFAGGWLDVPELTRHDGYVVNCAITPFSHPAGPYRPGAGVGGSAAAAAFQGKDAVQEELDKGVGWQDAAVILETGLCVWQSQRRPKLLLKTSGELLAGRMLLLDTGGEHATPDLTFRPRDYDLIAKASRAAYDGVLHNNFDRLVRATEFSYRAQTEEGMAPLPAIHGAIAWKYCGAGHGGYGLYLFPSKGVRDACVELDTLIVEPYLRSTDSW